MMDGLSVGSIVRCRNREWVVIPSADDKVLLLRPLTGSESEFCGIYKQLANLGFDRVEPANFPLPQPEDSSDAIGAELLWNAARLSLRDGAGPFRSLGRISVRPRPYQFVPLLMALRLQPIRLLIADDVGIGKTIEVLLIARELLDRREIQRLCILCPPYLCGQWKRELWEKFHIDAVVIRSGTVSQLEGNLPPGDHSIFGYYPYIVVSIDYAKSDRHRSSFLLNCPDFVIVDEAHGASIPTSQARSQQQRHELLKEIDQDPNRHLVLLTATPHSGIEDSFLSLLGLLKSDFAQIDLQHLTESDRNSLSRHFVQRRRVDVIHWLGEETPFPERESLEETYDLSPQYQKLFERVYHFSRELVRTGETLTGWRRRIRYWTALALLRSVMSSPAAAIAALQKREKSLSLEEATDEVYSSYIYEPTDEETIDVQPAHIVDEGENELSQGERQSLRQFAHLAELLRGNDNDRKVVRCSEIIRHLLREGYHSIVWCRYIATSNYVAEELSRRLGNEFTNLRVISITGDLSEDDRRIRIEELAKSARRVLVATDCLSEGINLQETFAAVVHYDLPWNPNRLEQREGRVDRFGQIAKKVKTVLLYGRDNPVDGAVLDVLLRKAKEIRRTLGITMSVPVDSETVMEAVLKALFFRGIQEQQLLLFNPTVQNFHRILDEATNREKESRTRFAQKSINPEDVDRELKETDAVLGNPDSVKRFILNACQRFGITIRTIRSSSNGIFTMTLLDRLPDIVRNTAPDRAEWQITFTTPAPENVTCLGRNHPFVATMAQYLLEEALTKGGNARAARCGAIRTRLVERRTVLLLLRLRFTVEEPDRKPILAEEVLVCGFRGFPNNLHWLTESEALDLLRNANAEVNVSPIERREALEEVLSWWNDFQSDLRSLIQQRGQRLENAHRRVRAAAHLSRRGLAVKPHLPPDLLGVLVLSPIPKGVSQ